MGQTLAYMVGKSQMHVLVATLPYLGHALPTETVVRALVKRGHTVTWLTGPAAEDRDAQWGDVPVALHRARRESGPVSPRG